MAYDEIMWGVEQITEKLTAMGYPPKAMRGYNVQAASGGKVKLYFTPPANTYLSDSNQIPLVQVGGVMIRKKAGSPITSLTDGELFVTIPAEDMNNYVTTPIVDEDVEIGTKYYYRFFPFSTQGTYNTQDNSQHGVMVTEEGSMLVFGFDQYFDDLNQDTQIVYPEDCENYNYDPIAWDGSSWGGWEHFIKNVLHCAPYMVKYTGEADYPLDPDNLGMKLDGSASDFAAGTSYQGAPMVWFENLYVKITTMTGGRKVRFCEGIPIGESSSDWKRLFEGLTSSGFWFPIFPYNFNAQTQNTAADPLYQTARAPLKIANTTKSIKEIKSQLSALTSKGDLITNDDCNAVRDLFYLVFKTVKNKPTSNLATDSKKSLLKQTGGYTTLANGFRPYHGIAFYSTLVMPYSSLYIDDMYYDFIVGYKFVNTENTVANNLGLAVIAIKRNNSNSRAFEKMLGATSGTWESNDNFTYYASGRLSSLGASTGVNSTYTYYSSVMTMPSKTGRLLTDTGGLKVMPKLRWQKRIDVGDRTINDSISIVSESALSGIAARYAFVYPAVKTANASQQKSFTAYGNPTYATIDVPTHVQGARNHLLGTAYHNGIISNIDTKDLSTGFSSTSTSLTSDSNVDNYFLTDNTSYYQNDISVADIVMTSYGNTGANLTPASYGVLTKDKFNTLCEIEPYRPYGVAFCMRPTTSAYRPWEEE